MLQTERIWRSTKVGTINNDQCEDKTQITATDNSIIFIMASQQDILSQPLLIVELCQRWIRLCFWPLKSSQGYSEPGPCVFHIRWSRLFFLSRRDLSLSWLLRRLKKKTKLKIDISKVADTWLNNSSPLLNVQHVLTKICKMYSFSLKGPLGRVVDGTSVFR